MKKTMLWSEVVVPSATKGEDDETMVKNSTVDMTASDDDSGDGGDDDDKDKDGAATFALAGATMAAAAFMF